MPESLTPAQQFAYDGLVDVTPPSTIGAFAGEVDEGDGAVSYLFAATMPGYPGWNWTVTVEQLPDAEPTILETELMPAEGALLAPDWVPWSERMDEYRAAQIAAGEALEDGEDDDIAAVAGDGTDEDESDEDESDGDESDDDDDDDDDDDLLGSDVLHGGDLDGVDIDELDPAGDDGSDDEDDDLSDEESDASSGGVEQGDEPEAQADGAGDEPPRASRGRQRARKAQQDDQGE